MLSVGHRRRPEHFISLIDKVGYFHYPNISCFIDRCLQVTRDDLNRIGRRMLDTKASVAAIGSLRKLPVYSDIEIGLLNKDVSTE